MELSIVIPAYNAAVSLPRALDSLVDVRFLGRYEILVVDDGSTDNTAEVCDNWCRLHPGIACCIRQGNGGVSSARNLGIAAANGDYIAFVDADDYAAPGYLGMAFDAKRGGEDYITFDYVRESDGSQRVVKPQLSPSDIGRARALALTCTANSPWSSLEQGSSVSPWSRSRGGPLLQPCLPREGSYGCIFSPNRLRVCGQRGQQDGAAPQRIRCRGLWEDVRGPDGLLRCVRSRRG